MASWNEYEELKAGIEAKRSPTPAEGLREQAVERLREIIRWYERDSTVTAPKPGETDTLLAAISAPARTERDGWRLVPVEPTEAMVEAHFAAHAKAETVFASVPEIWAGMLAAAPLPPAPPSREEIERVKIDGPPIPTYPSPSNAMKIGRCTRCGGHHWRGEVLPPCNGEPEVSGRTGASSYPTQEQIARTVLNGLRNERYPTEIAADVLSLFAGASA